MINEGEKENSVGFNCVALSVILKEVVLVCFSVGELF